MPPGWIVSYFSTGRSVCRVVVKVLDPARNRGGLTRVKQGSIISGRMRRIVARSRPLFLLAQLGVYILLPFLGTAWHTFAPEHDHLYLGVAQVHDAAPTVYTELDAAAVSAGRLGIRFGETVVHAFNPAAALQLFAIVISFGALNLLVVPPGLSQRLAHAKLFLRFPPLLPLDPPPVA